MTLHVTTGEFTGPLEVLYRLIQEKKLPINEISLSKVCDDYVNYVKELQQTHYQNSTYFLVIAATLLFIKSKSLLPTLTPTEEEEKSIGDLEQRLALYSIFMEATEILEPLFDTTASFFPHFHARTIVFAPGDSVHIKNLQESLESLIERTPLPTEQDTTTIQHVIHISDMIKRIQNSLSENGKISFSAITGYSGKKFDGSLEMTRTEKINLIVGFLALLEMTRDGLLQTVQKSAFDDIDIVSGATQ